MLAKTIVEQVIPTLGSLPEYPRWRTIYTPSSPLVTGVCLRSGHVLLHLLYRDEADVTAVPRPVHDGQNRVGRFFN